ncbi:MAG: hypothetical protein ACYSWT_07020 [Planctomycetota bacterium]
MNSMACPMVWIFSACSLVDAHLLGDDVDHFGFDFGFRHNEVS